MLIVAVATMLFSTDPDTANEIKAQSPMLTNNMVEGTHMVPGENPAILGMSKRKKMNNLLFNLMILNIDLFL